MKIEDVNALKGKVKTAIQSWGNNKIDELMGNRIDSKVILKNGLHNWLSRKDTQLNGYLDMLPLFFGDERGVIDTDSMVDMIANLFSSLETREFSLGPFELKAGHGELNVEFPHNIFSDILLGQVGSVKLTTDDLLEFKKLFNS